MSESARVQAWTLKGSRDGNEMTIRGLITSSDTEIFTCDFMRAAAQGLQDEGFTVAMSLQYEADVVV